MYRRPKVYRKVRAFGGEQRIAGLVVYILTNCGRKMIVKKILIVDDSPFMRGVLKDLLSNGVTVSSKFFEASDKKRALSILKKEKPHLVLLDIVMNEGELEGVETLREIKRLYPTTKVIMLTSVGQTAVIDECKRLGVDDFIQKPFDHSYVLKSVNEQLSML